MVWQMFMRFLHASGYLVRIGDSLQIPNEQFKVKIVDFHIDRWYRQEYKFKHRMLESITMAFQEIFLRQVKDVEKLKQSILALLVKVQDEMEGNEQFLQTIIGIALLRMRYWNRLALDKPMGKNMKKRSSRMKRVRTKLTPKKKAGSERNRPDVVLGSTKKKAALCVELKWTSDKKVRKIFVILGAAKLDFSLF